MLNLSALLVPALENTRAVGLRFDEVSPPFTLRTRDIHGGIVSVLAGSLSIRVSEIFFDLGERDRPPPVLEIPAAPATLGGRPGDRGGGARPKEGPC